MKRKKINKNYLIYYLIFIIIVIILSLKFDYSYINYNNNNCLDNIKVNKLGGIDFTSKDKYLSKIIIFPKGDYNNVTIIFGEVINNEYIIKELFNVTPKINKQYPPFIEPFYEVKLNSFNNIRNKRIFFIFGNYTEVSQKILNKNAKFIEYYRIPVLRAIIKYLTELKESNNIFINKYINIIFVIMFVLFSIATLIYLFFDLFFNKT